MDGEQNFSGTTMILRLRIRRHVMTIEFRELGKKKVWHADKRADRFNPLEPEYHLPFYVRLQTFDHRATLTALERNLRHRKVTTHSRGWTLKSIQETTKGYQEVFSYKPLRQRSKTATFQEHLMQFRPCAQMTYGETQLNLPLRGENWDQPAKWITRISLRPRTHRTAVCKRKAPLSALLLPQPGNLD